MRRTKRSWIENFRGLHDMTPGVAVPTIDIGPFLDGDARGKEAIAAQVAEVCERIGFLIISGHRFPQALFER
ncbi:MAG: 2-oxoglutarate and iron-dependent oxygenase domain-containing protein, partial [Burkholderiales bacterium]